MGKGIHNHSKHIKTSPFILLFPLLHNSVILMKNELIIICDSHGSWHIVLHKGRVHFQTIEHPLTQSVNAGAWFDQIPVWGLMLFIIRPRAAATTCKVVGHHQQEQSAPRPFWWHSSSAKGEGAPGRGPATSSPMGLTTLCMQKCVAGCCRGGFLQLAPWAGFVWVTFA